MTDEPMGSLPIDVEERRELRNVIAELARRGRTIRSSRLRHDMTNAVGAARNAVELLEENPSGDGAIRLLQMAQRNIDRAERLLAESDAERGVEEVGPADVVAETRPADRSARNQRNDLGGSGERDHRDTFGL